MSAVIDTLDWSRVDDDELSLCEALDRTLNAGVVADGHVVISVAGIDLLYLGLRVLLTSVETAREKGWWRP